MCQYLTAKHPLGPLGWFVRRTFQRFAGRNEYDVLADLRAALREAARVMTPGERPW